MRFIFCRAELLDLKLSCFWAQTSPICLHPSNHLVFPLPDHGNLNRSKCSWHIFLKTRKCVITVVSQVLLDCTPKEFNEIKFTVELRQEDAEVPCCHDHLLDKRYLCHEIRLEIKDVSGTAMCCQWVTGLALHK
ncbi:hypothetical protein L208DRAFT_1541838 [Tricholoma matsutake]|nr:hypothetical protein L208DRAFT_1541838 [Tricholoma matsutake 945]